MHEMTLAEALRLLGGCVLLCGTVAAPYLKLLTGSWLVFALTLAIGVLAGILLLALGAVLRQLQSLTDQLAALTGKTP